MTARAAQPKVGNQRRIIERPRLTKLLDETDARTILLLAPAGYGKTTLARQWAKTLTRAVWVTLTPAHRDVAVIAAELAGLGAGTSAADAVTAYLRAHSNPQRRAREISRLVADSLRDEHVQWVILDDYHELMPQEEAQEFVEVLNAQLNARFLIASRLRPSWATARLAIYGDVVEIGRSELALSHEEAELVLGAHPEGLNLIAQADGWPAVIGLAATASVVRLPGAGVDSAVLHDYFAEELFRSADDALRRDLMRLALAPDLEPETLVTISEDAPVLLDGARDLGFVTDSQGRNELHPLLRGFLLQKLAVLPEAPTMVANSVDACLKRGQWERAFDLILRFDRSDLVAPALEAAYHPLLRSGQLGTLAAFAARVRTAPSVPPPVVDLAEAELALADGAFDLAARVATRFLARVQDEEHPLASRSNMIIAESAYARADLGAAERAYRAAYEAARVDEDGIEALRGWTLTSLQGEMPGSEDLMTELQRNAPASAQDLVRHAILELIQLRFTSGFARADALLDEAEALLPQVEDPRPRSSFAYVAAYVSSLRARYDKAARWQELSDHDIDAFDLDFARPHSYWNHAHVALGQRKFGHAERLLQKLEDETKENPLDYHVLNARVLRARLCLSTGDAADALRRLPPTTREKVLPSILGEYHATRALALAATGRRNDALAAAERAEDETSAVEVKILSAGVRAITATRTQVRRQALALWEAAQALDVWDPVVAAVRISEPLAAALSQFESEREILGALYRRSGDHGLARRSGLRTRASGSAAELLSPRELEVLGLLARGYRNRDIAEALVVSLSTVKVHVRHIFEKLGVRTRAEAVTRLSLD